MTQPDLLETYRSQLQGLAGQSRLRVLEPRTGIDFSSNDYLGLASSARLARVLTAAIERGTAIGAGGSRLLRGNAPEHDELEAKAAAFFHAEHALFFGSGYLANFAVFATLPQRDDLVILDELVHASAHEGVRAGRAATAFARHNDTQSVEDEIRKWRAAGHRGRIWIAVESLYSMDGDFAPLPELKELADRYDSFFVVDEAHATGVFGPEGRGCAAAFEGCSNVVTVHTCSKALGGAGALVSAPRVLCDFIVNRCRPFIFSTAPSPLMAVAALEALAILKEEPERRERLAHLVEFAHRGASARYNARSNISQIMPVVIGQDAPTMKIATALRQRGFDVRGVRPPTVPVGTARLRIALTLNVEEPAISRLLDALAEELDAAGLPTGK